VPVVNFEPIFDNGLDFFAIADVGEFHFSPFHNNSLFRLATVRIIHPSPPFVDGPASLKSDAVFTRFSRRFFTSADQSISGWFQCGDGNFGAFGTRLKAAMGSLRETTNLFVFCSVENYASARIVRILPAGQPSGSIGLIPPRTILLNFRKFNLHFLLRGTGREYHFNSLVVLGAVV
jgi:hypothetical protein